MQSTQSGSLKNIWFYPPDEAGTSKLTLEFERSAPPNFSQYIPEHLREKITISQPQPQANSNKKVKALSERMLSIEIGESDSKSMLIALEILSYIQQKNLKIDVFPIKIVSNFSSINSIYLTPPNENEISRLSFAFKDAAPTNPSKYIPKHLQPNAVLRQPKNSPYYSEQVQAYRKKIVAIEIHEFDTKSMSTTLEVLAHSISTFSEKSF